MTTDTPGTPGLLLAERHRAEGALTGVVDGVRVPRHYGRPDDEYRYATDGAAVADRSHRGRIVVDGREPGRMLLGVITSSLPPEPGPWRTGSRGEGRYAAVLTPKGRMVTDLRLYRLPGTPERYLADFPRAGSTGLAAHMARYLPPRFARFRDTSGSTGHLTVLGPGAPAVIARALGGGPDEGVRASDVESLAEGGYLLVPAAPALPTAPGATEAGGEPAGGEVDEEGTGMEGVVLVARNGDLGAYAWDLMAAAESAGPLWDRLTGAGARPVGHGVLETLRMEAGRPAFGIDMDEGTIPTEAGIVDRAVDHAKGCYTGQEVIVRIRDRGHVNRRLRGLLLGEAPAPAPGTELFLPGDPKARGRVTAAAHSPRLGQAIALAWVRREVEPPAELRLGGPEGSPVAVRSLEDDWGV